MEDLCVVVTLASLRNPLSLEEQAYALIWVDPDVQHFTVVDSGCRAYDGWNAELSLSVKENQLQHSETEFVSIELYTRSCLQHELLGIVRIGLTDIMRELEGISQRIYAINDTSGAVTGSITISARVHGRSIAQKIRETVGGKLPSRVTYKGPTSCDGSLAQNVVAERGTYFTSESQDFSTTGNDSESQRKLGNRPEFSAAKETPASSTTTLTRTNSSGSEVDSSDSREKQHDLQMQNSRSCSYSTTSFGEWHSLQHTKLDSPRAFLHAERSSWYSQSISFDPPFELRETSTSLSTLLPTRHRSANDSHFRASQKERSVYGKRRSSSGSNVGNKSALASMPCQIEHEEMDLDNLVEGRVSDAQSSTDLAVDHYVASETPESEVYPENQHAQCSQQDHKLDKSPQPFLQTENNNTFRRFSESLVARRVKQFEEMIHMEGQAVNFCKASQKQRSELDAENPHKEITNSKSAMDDKTFQGHRLQRDIPHRPLPNAKSESADANQGSLHHEESSHPHPAVNSKSLRSALEELQRIEDIRLREYGPQEESWELSDVSSDGEEDSVNDTKSGNGSSGEGEIVRQSGSMEVSPLPPPQRRIRFLLDEACRRQSPTAKTLSVGKNQRRRGEEPCKGWWACSCKLGRLCCCTFYTST